MDIYTRTIVYSWLKLLLTIAGIILAVLLLLKSSKYIRAVMKRYSFMHRLRKTCRKEDVKLTVLSSPYRSVFKPSDTSELLLEKDNTLYSLKFFPCINAKDTYLFDRDGNYHTISNFKPIYLRSPRSPLDAGGIDSSKIRRLLLPLTLQYNDRIFKNSGQTNFTLSDIENAKPLLCLNPISVEMQMVKGSGTVTIFDGDTLCGYTVYSASGLLKMLTA